MAQSYPKRLIEVDLPIKRISAHARREKSIRHGHISTLHIWWARRPLAACRAVICAALWPDPFDELCPQAFREAATQVINNFAQQAMADKTIDEKASQLSMGRWASLTKQPLEAKNPEHWNVLRFALLDFIADFASWDNSTHPAYLRTSRTLTQAAHEALGGLPGTRPLVVDPFAGGGAIPLEALRVGADAFASDLNPVAVLLNKVVLEYIPKYRQRLADEVRKWGAWVKEQAEKELAEFYPPDPDGATPIAYLWARTIICEGPGCGAKVPLLRTLWLSKRTNNSVAIVFEKNPTEPEVFIELIENPKPSSVKEGTSKSWSAVCPCCGYTTAKKRVQAQLTKQQGGANSSSLLAVLFKNSKTGNKKYRRPGPADYIAIQSADKKWEQTRSDFLLKELSVFPNEKLPSITAHRAVGSQLPLYGFVEYQDLFTKRQLITLNAFRLALANLVKKLGDESGDQDFTVALVTILAFVLDKQADYATSLCRWVPGGEFIAGTLAGEKKYPMLSDFVEGNPISDVSGSWMNQLDWVVRYIERENHYDLGATSVVQRSAAQKLLPDHVVDGFITDPPYFDSAPYSDLSNFYFVWLKRTLRNFYPDLLKMDLAPKTEEMTVDHPNSEEETYRYKTLLSEAFSVGSTDVKEKGIGVIVFAHTSTAGWEALLSAIRVVPN
ncbi:MAG: DUF1156 domain-containing protein [Anaerolineaceae bacterium]|nr:DUF1156 domain-containing protein [Anaerolineaceae bacterium]